MRTLLSPVTVAEGFGPERPYGSVAPPGAGSTVSCDMVFRIVHVLLASDRVLKA